MLSLESIKRHAEINAEKKPENTIILSSFQLADMAIQFVLRIIELYKKGGVHRAIRSDDFSIKILENQEIIVSVIDFGGVERFAKRFDEDQQGYLCSKEIVNRVEYVPEIYHQQRNESAIYYESLAEVIYASIISAEEALSKIEVEQCSYFEGQCYTNLKIILGNAKKIIDNSHEQKPRVGRSEIEIDYVTHLEDDLKNFQFDIKNLKLIAQIKALALNSFLLNKENACIAPIQEELLENMAKVQRRQSVFNNENFGHWQEEFFQHCCEILNFHEIVSLGCDLLKLSKAAAAIIYIYHDKQDVLELSSDLTLRTYRQAEIFFQDVHNHHLAKEIFANFFQHRSALKAYELTRAYSIRWQEVVIEEMVERLLSPDFTTCGRIFNDALVDSVLLPRELDELLDRVFFVAQQTEKISDGIFIIQKLYCHEFIILCNKLFFTDTNFFPMLFENLYNIFTKSLKEVDNDASHKSYVKFLRKIALPGLDNCELPEINENSQFQYEQIIQSALSMSALFQPITTKNHKSKEKKLLFFALEQYRNNCVLDVLFVSPLKNLIEQGAKAQKIKTVELMDSVSKNDGFNRLKQCFLQNSQRMEGYIWSAYGLVYSHHLNPETYNQLNDSEIIVALSRIRVILPSFKCNKDFLNSYLMCLDRLPNDVAEINLKVSEEKLPSYYHNLICFFLENNVINNSADLFRKKSIQYLFDNRIHCCTAQEVLFIVEELSRGAVVPEEIKKILINIFPLLIDKLLMDVNVEGYSIYEVFYSDIINKIHACIINSSNNLFPIYCGYLLSRSIIQTQAQKFIFENFEKIYCLTRNDEEVRMCFLHMEPEWEKRLGILRNDFPNIELDLEWASGNINQVNDRYQLFYEKIEEMVHSILISESLSNIFNPEYPVCSFLKDKFISSYFEFSLSTSSSVSIKTKLLYMQMMMLKEKVFSLYQGKTYNPSENNNKIRLIKLSNFNGYPEEDFFCDFQVEKKNLLSFFMSDILYCFSMYFDDEFSLQVRLQYARFLMVGMGNFFANEIAGNFVLIYQDLVLDFFNRAKNYPINEMLDGDFIYAFIRVILLDIIFFNKSSSSDKKLLCLNFINNLLFEIDCLLVLPSVASAHLAVLNQFFGVNYYSPQQILTYRKTDGGGLTKEALEKAPYIWSLLYAAGDLERDCRILTMRSHLEAMCADLLKNILAREVSTILSVEECWLILTLLNDYHLVFNAYQRKPARPFYVLRRHFCKAIDFLVISEGFDEKIICQKLFGLVQICFKNNIFGASIPLSEECQLNLMREKINDFYKTEFYQNLCKRYSAAAQISNCSSSMYSTAFQRISESGINLKSTLTS